MSSKRNSLSLLAALLASGASSGETFEHMDHGAFNFAPGRSRFSPCPSAQYLRHRKRLRRNQMLRQRRVKR